MENDITVYAAPIFIISIFIEMYFAGRLNLKIHNKKDSLASIGMGLGSLVIGVGMKFLAFTLMFYLYEYRVLDLKMNIWWTWVLLLFADDFIFYWYHRLSHQVRVLWAAHINHHSSQNYNLAVALRQSWGEVIYKYSFWMILPVIGFHPLAIMTMIGINLIYQFFPHTKLVGKLGLFGLIFNTPSHHRVHHASNVRYLDKNHAGIFIIWDKLFGTFQPELDNEPVVYGITVNINSYNLFYIATHEYINLTKDIKRASKFSDKLKYIFNPPGWSHDGKNQTSKHLQSKLK
jgi:sterol desaturase/sphingolipid hydroxylase (fatty acid hydroxylase superfamily)